MYIIILDYTNGICDVKHTSTYNQDEDNFDWETTLKEEYKYCEISWIICNSLNIIL